MDVENDDIDDIEELTNLMNNVNIFSKQSNYDKLEHYYLYTKDLLHNNTYNYDTKKEINNFLLELLSLFNRYFQLLMYKGTTFETIANDNEYVYYERLVYIIDNNNVNDKLYNYHYDVDKFLDEFYNYLERQNK